MPNQPRRHAVFAACLLGAALSGGAARAYCSAPSLYGSPPDTAAGLTKPSPPFCMSAHRFSGTHTCDSWEIDRYTGAVNEYIRKLNRYADDARDYARRVLIFAHEAEDYADCAIKETESS